MESKDVYVPQPGEVVLIEWAASGISDAVGNVVRVEHAELHPNGGCIMLTGLGTRAEERRCRYRDAFCRVRPLRSAIDVECPGCKRGPAARCWNKVLGSEFGFGGPNDFHSARIDHFLSLTGQAPKDSATPSGVVTPVGPEPEGDSGTGRAAGVGYREARPKDPPAAPSGFRAPTDVYDVPCEACGARPDTSDDPRIVDEAALCHGEDRLALRDAERKHTVHALRVAAFEARGVRRVETGFIPKFRKCACGQDIDLRRPRDLPNRWELNRACNDCVREGSLISTPRVPLDARIREARDKLRHDLDRPLPPALRTWPEHWSNPGWES